MRRALEEAGSNYESRLLEGRLAGLRESLSHCHAGLIRAHRDYDSARKSGIWAFSAS